MGTNSTRLLVADVEGERLVELDRRSTVTRLGRGVDTSGQLPPRRSRTSVRRSPATWPPTSGLGAERVVALATRPSATPRTGAIHRRAARALRPRRAGAGRRRGGAADLGLGAAQGRPPAEDTLVVDIGGGSTELVVGSGAEVSFLRLAAGRGPSATPSATCTTTRPRPAELEDLAGRRPGADRRRASRAQAIAQANHGIGVAGTPTSLAAIEQSARPLRPGARARLRSCRSSRFSGCAPSSRRRRSTSGWR